MVLSNPRDSNASTSTLLASRLTPFSPPTHHRLRTIIFLSSRRRSHVRLGGRGRELTGRRKGVLHICSTRSGHWADIPDSNKHTGANMHPIPELSQCQVPQIEQPLQFVVKLTTPFKKVFNALCERQNASIGQWSACVFQFTHYRYIQIFT